MTGPPARGRCGVEGDRGPGLADRLPASPYAHELSPVELVWSHLKRSLANLAKRNLAQLIALVKIRLKRMQYRPASSRGREAWRGTLRHLCAGPVRVGNSPSPVGGGPFGLTWFRQADECG